MVNNVKPQKSQPKLKMCEVNHHGCSLDYHYFQFEIVYLPHSWRHRCNRHWPWPGGTWLIQKSVTSYGYVLSPVWIWPFSEAWYCLREVTGSVAQPSCEGRKKRQVFSSIWSTHLEIWCFRGSMHSSSNHTWNKLRSRLAKGKKQVFVQAAPTKSSADAILDHARQSERSCLWDVKVWIARGAKNI